MALAATGLAGLGSPVPVPAAAAASTLDCPVAPAEARVRAGSDGSDPNDLTHAQAVAAQRVVTARMRARGLSATSKARLPRVTVDVHVHVITRDDGSGGVTRDQIDRQLAVLNRAYAGRSSTASAPTLFRFALRSVDYTANSDWYDWDYPSPTATDPNPDPDDAEAKAALHQGGLDDLNVYIAALSDGLLGYASFPWDTSVTEDGLVLLNDSLPGGAAAPYNEGDTATHEVGHWLGLAHTFENGCTAPGDWVADTPYQDDGPNIFTCVESDDTCPQPGRDPVHNFMSYGDDPCLDRFTAGQSLRMALVWYAFRVEAGLVP